MIHLSASNLIMGATPLHYVFAYKLSKVFLRHATSYFLLFRKSAMHPCSIPLRLPRLPSLHSRSTSAAPLRYACLPARQGYANFAYLRYRSGRQAFAMQLSSIGILPMINLKAEGQQLLLLRTSNLRSIVLTQTEKLVLL